MGKKVTKKVPAKGAIRKGEPGKKIIKKPVIAKAKSEKVEKIEKRDKTDKKDKVDKKEKRGVVTSGGNEAPKRKLGIRGAAPWAARHAAKHAAEARARAAEPPPPGSARATIRVPTGAEEIKVKVIALHNAINQLKTLRKNFARSFYEVGQVLHEIRSQKLYEARGFGTFETFLDRETDIGKTTALRLILLVEVFKREAALEYGVDRVMQAMAVLDSQEKREQSSPPPGTSTKAPLPMHPPASK